MRYKMYFPMSNIHSQNTYLKSLSIAKGNFSDNFDCIIPQPYNHFIKINDIIYFVPSTKDFMYRLYNHLPLSSVSYAIPKNDMIVLNEFTADVIFSYFSNGRKFSKDLKRECLTKLKRRSPMIKIIDYPTSKCIYDLNGNYISFADNKFVLSNIKDDETVHHTVNTSKKDIVDGYIYNYISDSFISGNYNFSDKLKNTLAKITGNNHRSLKALAMLTAAAYTNDLPLKTAVVIVTENVSDSMLFFAKLFEYNLVRLTSAGVKNQKEFFSVYVDFLFASGGAYIINDEQPLNFDIIRKMVKSVYFNINDNAAGKIRFKNNIPLIVLTKSKDYAEKFKNQVKSYIITTDTELNCVNDISDYEFIQLRQALALYGLKLLNSPQNDESLTSSDAPGDDDVIKKFAKQFCRKREDAFVSKSELKDAFKKYTTAFYGSA